MKRASSILVFAILLASSIASANADSITLLSPDPTTGQIQTADMNIPFEFQLVSTSTNPTGSIVTLTDGTTTICTTPAITAATQCTGTGPYTCNVQCNSGSYSPATGTLTLTVSVAGGVTIGAATISPAFTVAASTIVPTMALTSLHATSYLRTNVATPFTAKLTFTSASVTTSTGKIAILVSSTSNMAANALVCQTTLAPSNCAPGSVANQVNCYVTCTYTFPSAGSYYVSALFGGDKSASTVIDQTSTTPMAVTALAPSASTTTVALNAPAVVNTVDNAPLFVSITANPASDPSANSATVSILDSASPPNTICTAVPLSSTQCTNSGGNFVCSVTCSRTPWGATTTQLVATYSGNANVAPGSSTASAISVQAAATASITTVSTLQSTTDVHVNAATNVIVKVAIAGGSANTGKVVLYSSTQPICTLAAFSSSNCVNTGGNYNCYFACSYTFTATGTYYLQAFFAGSSTTVDQSLSSPLTLTVKAAGTASTTTLVAPTTVRLADTTVPLEVSVSASTDPSLQGGFVTVLDNASPANQICSVALVAAQCATAAGATTCWVQCTNTFQWTAASTYSLVATYSGNTATGSSASSGQNVVVASAATASTVTFINMPTLTAGQSNTLTAQVVSNAANVGKVAFFVNGIQVCAAAAVGTCTTTSTTTCTVTCAYTFPATGPVTLSAFYLGDATNGNDAAIVSQAATVAAAATVTFPNPILNPSGVYVFTAMVSSTSNPSVNAGSAPSVTFADTTGTLCTVTSFTNCATVSTTTTCTATCTATRVAKGPATFTATYSGNGAIGSASATANLYTLPVTMYVYGKLV